MVLCEAENLKWIHVWLVIDRHSIRTRLRMHIEQSCRVSFRQASSHHLLKVSTLVFQAS